MRVNRVNNVNITQKSVPREFKKVVLCMCRVQYTLYTISATKLLFCS